VTDKRRGVLKQGGVKKGTCRQMAADPCCIQTEEGVKRGM
jgi:hypothetical protein